MRALLISVQVAALAAALLVATACRGGDEPGASPTATPTPKTYPSSSPGLTPGAGGGATLDLAATPATVTIYGANSGDLRSDLPGLASGDFNDDGADDLLIGARFGDGPGDARKDAGEAYVIFGGGALPEALDLAAGAQDVAVYGEAPGDNLGFSAAAGDINADGVDDLLLGAPAAGTGGTVYAVFGRAGLPPVLDLAAGEQSLTIEGPGGTAFFGDSLAAGDVNGDGTDDLIIGATFASDQERGGAQVGAVYAVFGGSRLGGTISSDDYDLSIFAPDPLDELGDTVVSADVNGDGIDDIVATAEAADGPDDDRDTAAEVHVFFGAEDIGGTLRIEDGDAGFSVYGAEAHDTLGFSLATGDVNGDGLADIIMGARLADGLDNKRDESGEVYVAFGSSKLGGELDLLRKPPDLTVFGADSSDLLGVSTAALDLDGQGGDELIIASVGGGPGNQRTFAGEVYVLGPLPERGSLDLAAGARLTVYGARAGDGLGGSLAGADLNGDGLREIVVVASTAPGLDGTPEAGRIYVVSAGAALADSPDAGG